MLDELFDTLESIPGIGRIYSFLPDYRGRGYLMEKARITVQDYEKLSDKIDQFPAGSLPGTEAEN